jgi:ABC-type molybdate transport system permease subunit
MQYLGGAPLELPLPVDPGIILFLFFSSASAMAFIILSWSMAALAYSLYDKLVSCTRCSCRLMVTPAWYRLAFFSSVSKWYDPY